MKFIVLSVVCLITVVENHEVNYQDVYKIAEKWANDIGQALWKISEAVTRRQDVINSFKMTFVAEENGYEILENVSDTLKLMMDKKVAAVKKIVRHAEELALRRKADLLANSTYDYFDSNNVTQTEFDPVMDPDLDLYLAKRDKLWMFQEEYYKYGNSMEKLKIHKNKIEIDKDHFEEFVNMSHVERKPGAFRYMPLEDHEHFKTQVNINFSSVRAAVNLYGREKKMLNDVRWSEALDATFKENFRKDPSLTWQYFASADGFMRLYPAIKWSEERYDQTYEYRIKSWYTDALTSPKDVVILVDISGSMKAHNRREISRHIVNEILDTLNDNDFVNIYTFNNRSLPLVDCFGDNLVQANEENLRLLRESLAVYTVEFPGDMSLGFENAFKLLQRYREGTGTGAQCNQAIMIITEGLDYDYHAELFELYNRPTKYYRPVRVFTYQLGTEPNDGMHMEWIACANMGFYVNISTIEEVHEKVLKYLSVMSRPVNMNCEKREIPHKTFLCERPEPLWSALYVDLADRKLSNWLWNKFEGNRQRDAFITFAKEESIRLKMIFKDNTHFMQQITHEYEKYRIPRNYSHLTTVSLPVLDLRPNSTSVLGVAAVDVSRDYIKSLITCYRLGANGYTFILTNNGYLLFHPDHRTDFQNILKPTFNRVDMTEVEILDDLNEPRLFGDAIIELRENIVLQKHGRRQLKVKSHIDDMKRLLLDTRHYYFTKLGGPFSIVLALPDKYGLNTVRHKADDFAASLKGTLANIMESQFWKIHPEWLYCKYYGLQKKFYSLEEELRYYLHDIAWVSTEKIKQCDKKLLQAFVKDFNVTDWFDNDLRSNATIKKIIDDFKVTLVLMATHSGLTRWQYTQFSGKDEEEYMQVNNKAIDEVWYRRAVDANYYETKFIYSVPFHKYLDYNVSKTLITASNTIFKEDDTKKAPAATVAYKFFQTTLYELFLAVTSSSGVYPCGNQLCNLTCDKDVLCYMIDNNGYVIVSNKARDVGKFLADIKVDVIIDVVENLVRDGVYKRTRFFDYQAICFYDPKTESPASRIKSFFGNLIDIVYWMVATLIYYVRSVYGDREYKNFTEKTVLYEKYAIAKSVPTPCDKEMWLYNLNKNAFVQKEHQEYKHREFNKTLGCSWSYILHQIPGSNLLFLIVNEHCKRQSPRVRYKYTPKPVEITYGNMSLPCYIAVQNNYTRKNYIKCFKKSIKEEKLNLLDKRYCADYEEDKDLRLRIY